MDETIIKLLTRNYQGLVSLTEMMVLFGHHNELLSILTQAIAIVAVVAEFDHPFYMMQLGRH